ncbi:hypothetical protein D3C80_1261320 [compost metagenome]
MLSQQHLVIEDQLCLALLNLLVNNGVHQPFMDGIRRFTQHGKLGVNGCIFLPLGNHGFGAQTGNQPHVLPLVERDF